MSRYCLDTSAYSRFQLGDRSVVELVDGADWIGMPAITLGELRSGFALGGHGHGNEERLAEFLRNPVVEEMGIDGSVSHHYAGIVADLRRAGTPVPTNDIWIAAAAVRVGCPVLTFDSHFHLIPRVGSVVLRLP